MLKQTNCDSYPWDNTRMTIINNITKAVALTGATSMIIGFLAGPDGLNNIVEFLANNGIAQIAQETLAFL